MAKQAVCIKAITGKMIDEESISLVAGSSLGIKKDEPVSVLQESAEDGYVIAGRESRCSLAMSKEKFDEHIKLEPGE